MSQSTLGDDELFGEAADEMRADVEEHLAEARAELPDADDVWETEADNVLGVLNGLKSALSAGDAAEHLRQAKKYYLLGERADAFDDAEDLEDEIDEIAAVIETLEEAHEQVGALAGTVPELRGTLEDLAEADEDEDDEE